MEKLYLHLTSKHYSNIFSTESVLPPSFYKKREFGIKRFKPVALGLSEDFLTLYPSTYWQNSDSEEETYPIWLEFDKQELQKQYNLTELEGVYLCEETIYFEFLAHFRCIFQSETERKETESEYFRYGEIKGVQKYTIIAEKLNLLQNPPKLDKIPEKKQSIDSLLSKDKQFNLLKGFIYGWAAGLMAENVANEYDFLEQLKTFRSHFDNMQRSLKMQAVLATKPITPPKKGSKSAPKNKVESQPISPAPVAVSEKEKNELQNYLDICKNNAICQTVLSNWVIVEECFNQFFTFVLKAQDLEKEQVKQLNERFISAYEAIFAQVNSQISSKKLENPTIFAGISIELPTKIKYTENEDERERGFFEIILTEILENPYGLIIGEVTNATKIEAIKRVSETAKKTEYNALVKKTLMSPKYNKATEQEPLEDGYRNEVLKIYDFYKKSALFNYTDLKSNVLQNWACFLSKIDSFGQLQNFLFFNKIANKKIAMGFWGAYKGFAEMTQPDLKAVISANKQQIADKLKEAYKIVFKQKVTTLEITTTIFEPAPTPEPSEGKEEEKKNTEVAITLEKTAESNTQLSENIASENYTIHQANVVISLKNGYEVVTFPELKTTITSNTKDKIKANDKTVNFEQLLKYAASEKWTDEQLARKALEILGVEIQ